MGTYHYYINVTVHVFAGVIWLGGLFFTGLIAAPVLRKVEPPELRSALFTALGSRFRSAGWVALAILIVTGLLNLHFRGYLNGILLQGTFWHSRFGTALAIKGAAVLAMLVVQVFHDFVIGPAAARHVGTPEAVALRRRAGRLARVSALLGVIILCAAVLLAR